MIKLAIVEDESVHAQLLKQYLENWAKENGRAVEIRLFSQAAAFLFDWEEKKDYAAVFLDIQMPGMNGMELAKRIRRDSESAQIVFATGIADYMQQGYEVAAMHYLLKPLREEQVYRCMERICKQSVQTEAWILLHSAQGVERVAAERIWWVEAVGHAASVGLERTALPAGLAGDGSGPARRDNGSGGSRMRSGNGVPASPVRSGIEGTGSPARLQHLEVTDSFGALESVLGGSFVKCHRSYLVNLSHVLRIEKADVVLDDGTRIPLSRRAYKGVNEAFIRFYQRGFETK